MSSDSDSDDDIKNNYTVNWRQLSTPTTSYSTNSSGIKRINVKYIQPSHTKRQRLQDGVSDIDPEIIDLTVDEQSTSVSGIVTEVTDLTHKKQPSVSDLLMTPEELTEFKEIRIDQQERYDDPFSSLKCSICMESMHKKSIEASKCGHLFCSSCILRAIQNQKRFKCPKCGKRIRLKKLHRIYTNF